MDILLTGASGFIGKTLLKQLSYLEGVNILLLTSEVVEGYKCILHNNYTFTKRDFINIGVSELDYVIHLGAFIPKSSMDVDNIDKCLSNITNTRYLIKNIPQITKKFIFASTVDVYGDSSIVIDEDIQPNPVSLYAMSKLYCENMLIKISHEMRFSLQILRIGHVYGKGEENYKKIIPTTMRHIILNKTPVIYSDGMEKRSFLYVEDCCKLIINSLFITVGVGAINVVSENSVTILDLVKMILKISEKDRSIIIENNTIVARNYIFRADKRKLYLGEEDYSLERGLKIEYNYMRNLIGTSVC